MKARIQKAWLSLLCLSAITFASAAELRTWTFSQDGQMKTSVGGTVSFKKKGRLDAAFIRLESTNVMLLAIHGEYLVLSATSLSDNDRAYLRRANGIEEADAGGIEQAALVRNEMSRRRREAATLRDEAATRHNLSQIELDAAAKLENEAARLSARATNLETQAQSQEAITDSSNSSVVTSRPAGSASYVKAKGDAAIIASAADQLEQDAAMLRRQAQEKRGKSSRLAREAANLEQTAQSLETNTTRSVAGQVFTP